jgi:uncharacterized membrane protein
MPYAWNDNSGDSRQILQLWPHQSLSPMGFAGFILGTSLLITLPLLPLLGSAALWGLLPFLVVAISGLWWALRRSNRDNQILEVLELGPEDAQLTRHNPRGAPQDWVCNRYWTTVELHEHGGPVPNYVTLRGNGREVEIGAFLSEDERKELYHDLRRRIRADVTRP